MRKRKYAGKMLYALDDPQSPFAESFRILRTNINFYLKDLSRKTLLITSPGVIDGTSTITANLAVVMAQTGNSVLIIDSNLRQPEMHEFFNLNNDYGLSNLLMEDLNVKDIIQKTDINGLWHLSSGPFTQNPADLLESQKMKSILSEAISHFDIILLNTPPVLGVTDTALLAPRVDGVILVVKAGSTKIDRVRDAKAQLERLNSEIIGIVLNEVTMKRKDLKYYYSHEKGKLLQGYHSSEGGSRQNTTKKVIHLEKNVAT